MKKVQVVITQKNKESDKLIKFQSNKQLEYEHTLQTKGNEDKTSTKIKNSNQKYESSFAHEKNQQKGRQLRFSYQNNFYGYYYCCSNFGHKAANCAFNFRSMQLRISKNSQLLQHRRRQSMSKQEHRTTQFRTKIRTHDRHINSFDLLYNEPECYFCHNFGHKDSDCHLKKYKQIQE